MDYKVKVLRPRIRPNKIWSEIIEKDCQTPNKYASKMLWTVGNGGVN